MPLKHLLRSTGSVALYYYNPNIQPREEYDRRLSVLQSFAKEQGVDLQIGPYETELWEETVGIYGGPYPLIAHAHDFELMKKARRERCSACYHLRFFSLAKTARHNEITTIDTTLTISPYQDTQAIHEALEHAAASSDLLAQQSDWRGYYQEATALSRALGMYRQNFCGCRFSEQEAQLERAARKAGKKNASETRA